MSVYDEVRAERERAHALHGDRSIEAWPADDPARLPILVEEVGEVAKEHNEAVLEERSIDLTKLRAELIQVAAVACAWADRIGEEQAAPVDDMARRLARKIGDPRGIPRTQLERHEPTLADRLRHDVERRIDLDDTRRPKHIDDIAADLERGLGRPVTYAEVAEAYAVQRRREAEEQRDRDELARDRDREWWAGADDERVTPE